MSHLTAPPVVALTTPLVLLGTWHTHGDVIGELYRMGFPLFLVPETLSALPPCCLVIIAIEEAEALEPLQQRAIHAGISWVGYCPAELIPLAYQYGAVNVFPNSMASQMVAQAIQRVLTHLTSSVPAIPMSTHPQPYKQGELLALRATEVLIVTSGIVALTALHEDGHQVLLGLFGAGQWIVGHPNDNCYLQLIAHTDTSVGVQRWENVQTLPDTPLQLRATLRQREAWASAQARPSVEGRLRGILGLLGEQFGEGHAGGTLLQVRLTHQDLASAVGAARTTVSRLLGKLQQRSLLRAQAGYFWISPVLASPHQ